MAKRFYYSNQVDFLSEGATPLGLMVWDDTDLRYFAAPGNKDEAKRMNDSFPLLAEYGKTMADWLEYYLNGGGGGYRSFAIPEECEAESLEDVARMMRQKHDVPYVIPEPAPEELDEVLVIAFLEATQYGAEIELIGPDWSARDRSSIVGFSVGYPGMEPQGVFAYVPFPIGVPPYLPNTRFFVTSLEREGDVWRLYGRSGVMDCPATELVVRPAHGDLKAAVSQERDRMPADVQAHVISALKAMTNPLHV